MFLFGNRQGNYDRCKKEKILSRASNLSGFVAHNLSGLNGAKGGAYDPDKTATGDSEDEI